MSVLGNWLGIPGHRFRQERTPFGDGWVAVVDDALNVREEFPKRPHARVPDGLDEKRALGFCDYKAKEVWVCFNAFGTGPDIRVLGHEMFHRIWREKGEPE